MLIDHFSTKSYTEECNNGDGCAYFFWNIIFSTIICAITSLLLLNTEGINARLYYGKAAEI